MMQLEGLPVSIEVLCAAGQVGRTGYYRYFDEHVPRQAETELRDKIQLVALENRCYGYRRVVAASRLQGILVNHKRVLRVMREDNLLSLRKRKFVVTTDSSHGRAVYPNLITNLTLTVPNQLWVADITYIRLMEEFVFLAVVLDAFSRRVLGWELDESLQTSLAMRALDRALADRPISAGIIHHSDQGVQYASAEYVDRLQELGFQISMSPRSPLGERPSRKLHQDSQGRRSVAEAIPRYGAGPPLHRALSGRCVQPASIALRFRLHGSGSVRSQLPTQ